MAGISKHRLTFLSICPEYFDSFRLSHVASRAEKLGLAEVESIDLRSYAGGSFRNIDDSPYGGGRGMLLRVEPIDAALQDLREEHSHVIFLSPHGKTFRQADARRLAEHSHVILVCGHFEGIDERAFAYADEILSIGDFILTGGEPAAVAVGDAILRLLDGNLKEGSADDESFEQSMLEYPQYTRPREYKGAEVPDILLSGNHEAVAAWRTEAALQRTRKYRPDLLDRDDGK